MAVSWFEEAHFLGAVFYRQDPDVGLLAFFDVQVERHVASAEVVDSEAHVAGLLKDQLSVLVLSLLDLDLEAVRGVDAVLEGADLEDTCIAQVVGPLDFQLTELFGDEFVDLVGFLVEGREHVDERPDLVGIEDHAVGLVLLVQVDELKDIRLPTLEYEALRKDFILAHVGDFHLQDELVVAQGYVLGDVERQVGLELVFLGLVARDLSFDEVDLRIL